MKKCIIRRLSCFLLVLLVVAAPSFASSDIPEEHREAFRKGYRDGILGKGRPIGSHKFLFHYLSRLADMGIDFSTKMIVESADSFLFGSIFVEFQDGVVQRAIYSHGLLPSKKDDACGLAAFIYSFRSDIISSYDDFSSLLDIIFNATEEEPYLIQKYAFHTVFDNEIIMVFAELQPD